MDVKVVVANYRASNQASFLRYLELLSEKRGDGGLLHGGHIHFIQGEMGDFVLKAAIQAVLDRVPDVFPLELPEIVQKNPDFGPTEAMQSAFKDINKGLIIPIGGGEIIEIISLARKYAANEAMED